MAKEYYCCGTVVHVTYEHDGITEDARHILAQCNDDAFLFQVITIDGMHAGAVEGYIRPEADTDGAYVSLTHLKRQLIQFVFGRKMKMRVVEKVIVRR